MVVVGKQLEVEGNGTTFFRELEPSKLNNELFNVHMSIHNEVVL